MTETTRLLFDPVLPAPVLAGVTTVFIVLAVLACRRFPAKLSQQTRVMLRALRFAAIVLVLLGLFRPRVERREPVTVKMAVPIVLDATRSLDIRDGGEGRTRLEQLRAFLDVNRSVFSRLEERFDATWFAFDKTARPTDPSALGSEGAVTAIAGALEDVLAFTRGKRLAGVILATDGTVTADKDLAGAVERLRALNVPVYTIGLGQDTPGEVHRDAAVARLRAKPVVFTGVEAPVDAELAFTGLGGRTVRVDALLDGEPFDHRDVKVDGSLRRETVRFSYFPANPGAHKVTVRVDGADDEVVLTNNEQSTYVNVISGGLSVLFLEGGVRPEIKFIKRAIESSQRLRATFVLKRPGAALPGGDRMLAGFDVVVLGDLPASHLSAGEIKALEDAVADGKGLVLLASRRSFGLGQYHRTALGEMSPVRTRAADRWVDEPVKVRLTDTGADHAALRLAKDAGESAGAWNALAECLGYLAAGDPKPASEILAETSAGAPLIVVGQYGHGRTVAVLVDSTWRWVLAENDTAELQARFWQQLLLFASGRDMEEENQVWIEMRDYSFVRDQKVLFTVRARTADGDFPEDLEITASHVSPDGTRRAIPLDRAPQAFAGVLEPARAGDHKILVEATRGGEPFASASADFLVYLGDAEFEELVADLDTLRLLSHDTGGVFRRPDNARATLEEIIDLPDTHEVTAATRTELWNAPAIFALLALCLCAEWLIRKHHGMP